MTDLQRPLDQTDKTVPAPTGKANAVRRAGDYLFPARKRTTTLYVLTATTLLYLLMEFAFNARLLDAVGGITNADSIEGIEVWGRCLSGFAAALLAWPWLLKKPPLKRAKLTGLVLVTALVMSAVYIGERSLIDTIVARSTAAQRYAAAHLMLLQQSLVTGDAHVQDLALSRAQMNAPDGKAFLATFPLMLLQIDDVENRISAQKGTLIRRAVDKGYGGPVTAFNHYVEALNELKTAYEGQYQPGSRKFQTAIQSIAQQQASAWTDYERQLRSKGLSPSSVPPRHHERVRQDLRAKGVPVEAQWQLDDAAGFYAAVNRSIRSKAERDYRAAVEKALGEYIAPNLSAEAFLLSPPIQKRLLANLRYPCELTVKLGYQNPTEYERGVYGRVVDILTRQKLNSLSARPEEYADGKKYSQSGQDSMRALVAPPLALAFSVVGAVAHFFKLCLFLIECLWCRAPRNAGVKVGTIGSTIVLMIGFFSVCMSSPITQQTLYQKHVHEAAQQEDPYSIQRFVVVHAIRGTIHVQPFVYPWFEQVRARLFMGLTFGYDAPETPHPTKAHPNQDVPRACIKST